MQTHWGQSAVRLNLDRWSNGKLYQNTQKGVFQVKIIYCELNKKIKHTGEIANTGLLYV